LGDHTDISLADWLAKPRAELAKLAEEMAGNVEKQQDFSRTNVETLDLLPKLHAPVTVPVFTRSVYSEAAGFSLPPYLKQGAKDPVVALHLARNGDREAALKLADPADKAFVSEIDAWRGERNYPVEWTRLVALTLQSAQFKVAHGQIEGATELVLLHKQLRELLDAKAAKGPLGAALLPLGREALKLAVPAWREPKENKPLLAQDVEAALAEWGDIAAPVFGLTSHARKDEITQLLGVVGEGRTISAAKPEEVERSLDFLGVPLAHEGAKAVVAFLDAKDRLDDLLILYKPKINEHYPEPEHLAHHLVESGFVSQKPISGPGQVRQVFEGGGLNYDVTLFTHSNAAGAVIRLVPSAHADAKNSAVFARNPREFGAIGLDRGYEANRLRLDPFAPGEPVKFEKTATLQKIAQPVAAFSPNGVILKREPGFDLLASVTLHWPADVSLDGLYRLGLPLWSAYGKSRLETVEDVEGGSLVLTWENATTRLRLVVPNAEKSPELIAEDARGKQGLAARADVAAKIDRDERLARLEAGKPETRLPRALEVNALTTNGLQFEGLHLGIDREEALAALPNTQTLRRQTLTDGLSLLFLSEPPPKATFWARQMFLRFGQDKKLVEVRVRYQEGPAQPSPQAPGLLESLQRTAGAPEELPAPWAALWTDISAPRRHPILYRWRDDATLLTFQRDEGGAEVTLRDCPADYPLGLNLPPLQFCSRGVETCALGDLRTQVLERYNNKQPHKLGNGAEVLTEPVASPYDVLLVWYEKGKVSRIIGRQRAKSGVAANEVGAALQTAWSVNIDHLGYVRRFEGQRGQVQAAYGWHDDVTRVRTFAQETEEGIRLFTEFRDWPVAVKTVAAKSTPVDPLP
jgi:hypothetical protein